jgi:hypothetical protein
MTIAIALILPSFRIRQTMYITRDRCINKDSTLECLILSVSLRLLVWRIQRRDSKIPSWLSRHPNRRLPMHQRNLSQFQDLIIQANHSVRGNNCNTRAILWVRIKRYPISQSILLLLKVLRLSFSLHPDLVQLVPIKPLPLH